MKKRRIGILVALLVVIGGGAGGWYLTDQRHYASLVDTPQEVEKWSADPRPLLQEAAVKKEVTKINRQNTSQDVSMAGLTTVVIPGLRGAWSIDHQTKEAAFGTDWVPQGVTQSEDHYYVSVYDGDHKLNSLIFQIDKQSGKYLKTLILASKAHVGGIVYDRKFQRLIYSNDTSEMAGFGVIEKADIDAYVASEAQKPIKAQKIPWAFGARTSAITLYDNQLVVAKYGKKADDRSVVAIPLQANGLPQAITSGDLTKIANEIAAETTKSDKKTLLSLLIEKGYINSYNPGWNRLQGVAISETGLTFLSQSNGNAPGKIWAQVPSGKGWSKLSFTPPEDSPHVVAVPHSVEEVSISPDESQMALIFESGAKKYRESGVFFKRPTYVDRILILPITITDTNK